MKELQIKVIHSNNTIAKINVKENEYDQIVKDIKVFLTDGNKLEIEIVDD